MGSHPDRVSILKSAHCLLSFLALCFASSITYSANSTVENCSSLSSPEWLPQEIWVWTKLCQRELADLNEYLGTNESLNPYDIPMGSWSSQRVLTSTFLEEILLIQPYTEALRNKGVRIYGAWYQQPINLQGTEIDNYVDLRYSRFDNDVIFSLVKNDQRIWLNNSWFLNDVSFFSARINELIFGQNRVDGVFQIANGIINSGATFQGSRFNGYVNLSGVRGGGISFGSFRPNTWGPSSAATLRGAQLFSFTDSLSSWDGLRGKLDLNGFSYGQFGGTENSTVRDFSAGSASERPVQDLLTWLEMQESRDEILILQPYEQLALVLYATGQDAKAERILYEKNEYQRSHITTTWGDHLWLMTKKTVIGYGYQIWRAVLWLFLLVGAGTVVLRFYPGDHKFNTLQSLLYSLDQAIPLVSLQPAHEDIARRHTISVRSYFLAHQILSLILLSFLGAGLAGAIG